MPTQLDEFPSGLLDDVGESKEVTLSETASDDTYLIKWLRSVSCGINAGTGFDSASASIEIDIEKDKGSGWENIASRTYSASVVGDGTQSDSDSGEDSVEEVDSGLGSGDKIRIIVTAHSVDPGSTGSASASVDPDEVEYQTAAPVDGDLDETVLSPTASGDGSTGAPLEGDLDETVLAPTAEGEGVVGREAALDEIVLAPTAEGVGEVERLGALDETVLAPTASGSGVSEKFGDLDETVLSPTASGDGEVKDPLQGDLDETVLAPTADGEGEYLDPVFANLIGTVLAPTVEGEGITSPWSLPHEPDKDGFTEDSVESGIWTPDPVPEDDTWTED